MLKSKKILTRQSEIRQKLAGIEFEKATDEQRKEVEALTAEYARNETEYRAALILEEEDRQKLEANPDPDPDKPKDEFRRECEAFSIVDALKGDTLTGRELEVCTELRKAQQGAGIEDKGGILVPWAALLAGGEEKRADTYISDAAAKGGAFFERPQLSAIERIFETTSAGAFGARILQVMGEPRLPELTAGATAGFVADGSGKDAEDITVATHAPTVKTLTGRYAFNRQAIVSGGMPESLLRADLSRSIMAGLDKAFWRGSGSSNQPTGLSAALTAVAISEAPDLNDLMNWAATDMNGAGETITNMQGGAGVGGRVSFAMNPALYSVILRGTASGIQFSNDAEALRSFGVNLVASAYVGDVAANTKKTTPLFSYAMGMRPHANIVQWGSLELIRDPYTLSKTGRIAITAFLFCDFMFTQKTTRFHARTVQTIA